MQYNSLGEGGERLACSIIPRRIEYSYADYKQYQPPKFKSEHFLLAFTVAAMIWAAL